MSPDPSTFQLSARTSAHIASEADDLRLPFLYQSEEYRKVASIMERIREELDENPHRLPEEKIEEKRKKVEQQFELYEKAWMLYLSGETNYSEIGRQLEVKNARDWLVGKIPSVILRADPEWRNARSKQVVIPEGISTDFAYVLGSYAATAKPSRKRTELILQSRDIETIEALQSALREGCQLDASYNVCTDRQERYYSISVNQKILTRYLHESSDSNRHVVFEHLVTEEEKKAFLRGFIDFAGGSMLPDVHKYRVNRDKNPTLIHEVAVVLKQIGIHARVEQGNHPSFIIQDWAQLIRLRDSGIVQSPRLQPKLEQMLSSWEPGRKEFLAEHYRVVMSRVREIPGYEKVEPVRLWKRVLSALPFEVHLETFKHWLGGAKPLSVKRLEALEQHEAEIFTEERKNALNQAVAKRFGSDAVTLEGVLTSLSELSLNEYERLLTAGFEDTRIFRLAELNDVPSAEEYITLAETLGYQISCRFMQHYYSRMKDPVGFFGYLERELMKGPYATPFQALREPLEVFIFRAFDEGRDVYAELAERFDRYATTTNGRRVSAS